MFNKFSPSEAAVSVFEFTKLHPKFVLRYSLIYGIFQVVSVLLLTATGYFGMLKQMTAIESGKASEEVLKDIFSSMNWAAFTVLIVISIVFGIMILGMALRKTVNNQEIGFHGLIWGKDENSLLVAGISLFFIYFGGFFIGGIIGGVVSGFGIGDIAEPLILALISVIMIWFVVAISQYGVISVVNGKFSLKETLAETKDQFWSYMGAYVLAFVLAMIASLVIQGSLGAIFGMSSFNPENLDNILPASFAAALNPKFILYYFSIGLFSGFVNIAFVCVGSYAYHKKREITQQPPEELPQS